LLAACVAGGGTGTVRFATADAPDFAIAAPSGFCVADDSLSRLGASKFAAFTRCNGTGAVLTATVGPPGSGVGLDLSGQALADYFTGTEGRAALSRAGRAATVRVHDVTGSSDAVLVRLTDTAPRPSEIGPGESWRAILSDVGASCHAGRGAGADRPPCARRRPHPDRAFRGGNTGRKRAVTKRTRTLEKIVRLMLLQLQK
jgi:hypothetical protein